MCAYGVLQNELGTKYMGQTDFREGLFGKNRNFAQFTISFQYWKKFNISTYTFYQKIQNGM